jgi:hypothetical protein
VYQNEEVPSVLVRPIERPAGELKPQIKKKPKTKIGDMDEDIPM